MPTVEITEDEAIWTPNPGGQAGFINDYRHRYVAFAAGWGTGKTWAGARKSASLHVFNAFDDDGRPTYCKGLVIEPTYSLARTIAIPELRAAFDEAGLSHRFVGDPQRFCFELPDLGMRGRPSEILIRSADSPELITGFQVAWCWGDEAARWYSHAEDPTQDALLQADGRLRDPRARLLQMNLTFTHEGDATPVYRRFENDKRPGHAIYHGRTEENPAMRAFAEEQRRQLTPELASQYLDGNAANFRGSSVYSSFDADRNLDAGLVLAEQLPLQLAVDFNISPGMHAIVGQHVQTADLLTAVHEIHEPRLDVRGMVARLMEFVKRQGGWKWPELHLFGDPAGNSKWSASGEQSAWDVLREAVRAADFRYLSEPVRVVSKVGKSAPLVGDRVNAVNCALHGVDGRVRYRIHPSCVNLIRDFKQMKWQDGELGKADRRLSHASDADGYRVEWLMPIRKRRDTGAGGIGFAG